MFPALPLPTKSAPDVPRQTWEDKTRIFADAKIRNDRVAIHRPNPTEGRPSEPAIGHVQNFDKASVTIHNGRGPITFKEPEIGKVELYRK